MLMQVVISLQVGTDIDLQMYEGAIHSMYHAISGVKSCISDKSHGIGIAYFGDIRHGKV